MPKRIHDGLKKRCPRNPQTGKRCARKDWPKCSHPWHFSFHHGGKEHRFSLDVVAGAKNEQPPRSKADAIIWRDRLRTEIRNSIDPLARAIAPVSGLSVGDAVDRYLEALPRMQSKRSRMPLRPMTIRQAASALRVARLCPVPSSQHKVLAFGEKRLIDVTPLDIEAIRDARNPHGPVGCNRLLAWVRHFLNWCVRKKLIKESPFVQQREDGDGLMNAESDRNRRLEHGEADRLLASAGPHLRSLIVAALYTGCRVGELLSLQWHQVRVDERGEFRWLELPAAKTKTGKPRTLPVGPVSAGSWQCGAKHRTASRIRRRPTCLVTRSASASNR